MQNGPYCYCIQLDEDRDSQCYWRRYELLIGGPAAGLKKYLKCKGYLETNSGKTIVTYGQGVLGNGETNKLLGKNEVSL